MTYKYKLVQWVLGGIRTWEDKTVWSLVTDDNHYTTNLPAKIRNKHAIYLFDLRLGREPGMWITVQAINQLLAYCCYVNARLLCMLFEFSIDLTLKYILESFLHIIYCTFHVITWIINVIWFFFENTTVKNLVAMETSNLCDY